MPRTETCTWPQMKEFFCRHPAAFLPFGAHEQHGPHCPLNTDTVIASALAASLAQHFEALLLPAIPYGETWNNEGFAGTLSISFETVQHILHDLGRGLKRSGAGALVIVNGHFGNRAPLEQTCRRLRFEDGLPVLLLDYPGLERVAADVCESAPAAPSFYHADEFETSLMLYLQPDTVNMQLAAAEYPQFPATFGAEPVMLDGFCKSGVFGDPSGATAEKGRRIFEGLLAESVQVVSLFLQGVTRL